MENQLNKESNKKLQQAEQQLQQKLPREQKNTILNTKIMRNTKKQECMTHMQGKKKKLA